MLEFRPIVFVRSAKGRNGCKITRRVEDFIDRHKLTNLVEFAQEGSDRAKEAHAAAVLNEAFKNTGKNPPRKSEGFPLVCFRDKNIGVTWACALPNSDQLLKLLSLVNA